MAVFLVLYFIAQYYKPKEVDWRITLSSKDKIPYGSFIVYDQLKSLFSETKIETVQEPVYNLVNNSTDSNSAYLLVEGDIQTTKTDEEELLNYVLMGNYVFISAAGFSKTLQDTLGFETGDFFIPFDADSTSVNFVNTYLKKDTNYRFYKNRIDGVFKKFDTSASTVLGVNHRNEANFIKIRFGAGAFFIHTAPLCFTNQFGLFKKNADYIAGALSYIP
jgi:hypothetical protein